jgi:hypothetical protein
MNSGLDKSLIKILCIGMPLNLFSHPLPDDDLLRPKIQVVSMQPMSIVITLKPRENVSAVSVETPNNLGGRLVQCALGALVKDQDYECRVSGFADSSEAVFSISVNGVVLDADGHRHLSTRNFSITNPRFDVEDFRAERRREAQAALAAGRTERASENKK